MKQTNPIVFNVKVLKKHQPPEKRKENQYWEHCCRDISISLNVKAQLWYAPSKKNDKQYDQHRNSTSTKQEWSRKEEHNQQTTQTNYIIIQTGVLVKQGTSWNKGKGILSSKYQVAYVQHTETKKTKCIFFFSIQYWQSNCCALRVNEHISTTYMKVFCSRAWP